jgi:O-antigen/teichoic acid export membrane protein
VLIERAGIDANGIFSNAWRIASVYLGSVTATGLAYLLPTLSRCGSDAELSQEVDGALRFYLLILPLPMIAIMAAGELLIWLVLSSAFVPGAVLLLLLVPAELMRIIRETIALPLVARGKIAAYTLLSAVQPLAFVALAFLLIPDIGISGAAWAYLLGHLVALLANAIVSASAFRLTFSASLLRLLLASLVALAGAGVAAFLFPLGPTRILVTLAIMLAWVAAVFSDPAARTMAREKLGRMSRGAAR